MQEEVKYDISIIIVGWNVKKLVLDCVASIYEHVRDVSFEVIYVDNGSSDGTITALQEQFGQVRIIANSRNVGFGPANNQGIEVMAGRYAVILNSDTIVKPGAFEEIVRYMDAHPQVGCSGGELLNADDTRQNTIHYYPTLLTEFANKSLLTILFPRRFPSKRQAYTEPIEVEAVLGAYMVVRREVIEQVGAFDPDYFFFFEETDWCYRMKQAGWQIKFVPASKIYHLQGKTVRRYKREVKIEYFRSRYLFFRKHRSRLSLVLLTAGLVTRLTINTILMSALTLVSLGCYAPFRNKSAVYAALLWWHLRGCPAGEGLAKI